MATFATETLRDRQRSAPRVQLRVVHPLDDLRETKPDLTQLGRMPLTRSVRLSLAALRAYLLAMTALLAYHLVALAGQAH